MSKTVLILVNHDIVIYNFRKELVEALLNKGYKVVLSCPYGKSLDKLVEIGVTYIDLTIDRHGMNPFNDMKLLFHYNSLIKEYQPDVVLTYTIKPNIYGGIVARFSHTPYIANITGLGTAIENKGLLQLITTKLYKFALKKARMVFFQNKDNMNYMISKGIKGESYKLIPGSGVNTEYFNYIEYPRDEILHFLFIGRVMKDKGIDYFLEAAKTIKEKYPHTVFHVIGSYEEDYKKTLEDFQLKGFVEYHGRVDDVRQYHKIAHAIIHPSFHEGMSNVLLEAASSGRPILASNVPGCKETFDDNVTGYSFEVKNQVSLNQIIKKFINLPFEEKKKMGIKAREKVYNEFNRKNVVETYLYTIDNALEEKK